MILKEIGDLSNVYPFTINHILYTKNKAIDEIHFHFKSERNMYSVSFELLDWNDETFYELNFKTFGGSYFDSTNEKVAIKVITTVAKILLSILKNYNIAFVPIIIKGAAKRGGNEKYEDETKRDKIYKYIAQKVIKDIPNYTFQDKGKAGFVLIPKKQLQLQEKVNKISPFKNYQQKLESQNFEAEFRPVNDHLVTIQIIGMPKKFQSKGYGSAILNTLCKMADQYGTTLQLKPAASSTHSRTKLINFYSKFGFIENKGENRNDEYQYMYRFPKNSLVESVLLEKKASYKYGAIMLNLSCSKTKSIHQKIDKNDLYEEKDSDKYGIEREQHCTLLYGLHKEVTKEHVKEILNQFTFPKTIKAEKISLFENEKYDVLKFDIEKKDLISINKKLKSLPYTNEYSDYKPHMTVAYIKKGEGKKYMEMFKNIKNVECSVEDVLFSTSSGEKHNIKIKKKESLAEKTGLSEKILKEVFNINNLPEFVAKIKTLQRKFQNEGCDIDIHFRHEQSIQLSKILIPKEKRNEQLGTQFMKELVSLADEFEIIITLSASDSFGSNLNRLNKFYQRFGFRKNIGGKADHRFSDNMIREPKGI